jgi:hypothetical protein
VLLLLLLLMVADTLNYWQDPTTVIGGCGVFWQTAEAQ